MTECVRNAVKLDGEIPTYVDILQGVAQGCTCTISTILFKVYINDMIEVEPARQRVTMGEYTVSGLLFADDFVGISQTPEGLQEQIEKAKH